MLPRYRYLVTQHRRETASIMTGMRNGIAMIVPMENDVEDDIHAGVPSISRTSETRLSQIPPETKGEDIYK